VLGDQYVKPVIDPAPRWGETRGPEDLQKSFSMEIILCFYEIHILGKTGECDLVVVRFVIPRKGCCLHILLIFFYKFLFYSSFLFLLF